MKFKSILQKLTNCCLFLLLLQTANLSAQSTVDSTDESGFVLPELPKQKICFSPTSIAQSVVFYKKTASAYIELAGSVVAIDVLLTKVGSSKSLSLSVTNQAILLKNLEQNSNYIVTAKNSCDEVVELAKLSTTITKGGEILVSNKLFNAISAWQVNPLGRKLSSYIKELPTVSAHEKLSFIQQYFDKEPIAEEDADIEQNLASIGGANTTSMACACKVVLVNSTQIVIPFDGVYSDGSTVPRVTALNGWTVDGNSSFWHVTSTRGAAKYQQLRQEGKREHSREAFLQNAKDATSSIFGQLQYSLVCADGFELPKDCGCEKILDVSYRYDTKLRASSTINSCFLCGSKGSNSSAEDWAVAVVYDEVNNASTVLGASKAFVISECSKTVNKDWWLNIVDIAGTIGKGILLRNNIDTNTLKATNLVTDLTTQIKSLITTPYFSKVGCTSGEKSGNLLDGQRRLALLPNQPLRVNLFSFSNLSVSGFTSWSNITEILSDYHLAGVVRNSLKEPAVECCTDKFANWVLGYVPGSPLEAPSLKQTIGSFFKNWASWNAPIDQWTGVVTLPADIGSLTNPSCTVKFTGDTPTDQFQIVNQNGNFYLKGNKDGQPYNYSILDISGRVIKTGNGNSEMEKVLEQNSNQTSGVYLIKVLKKGQTETHKIVLTK
jgi:hypothetical protein